MKKKSTSTSAFFDLRVLIGLFLVVASVFLALLGFGMFSNAAAQPNVGNTTLAGQTQQAIGQRMGQMTVISAVHSDLSAPLRDQASGTAAKREA